MGTDAVHMIISFLASDVTFQWFRKTLMFVDVVFTISHLANTSLADTL
jgi:hypothetical protein